MRQLIIDLNDEELLGLYRILLDKDEKGALDFMRRKLENKIQRMVEGLEQCRPVETTVKSRLDDITKKK